MEVPEVREHLRVDRLVIEVADVSGYAVVEDRAREVGGHEAHAGVFEVHADHGVGPQVDAEEVGGSSPVASSRPTTRTQPERCRAWTARRNVGRLIRVAAPSPANVSGRASRWVRIVRCVSMGKGAGAVGRATIPSSAGPLA